MSITLWPQAASHTSSSLFPYSFRIFDGPFGYAGARDSASSRYAGCLESGVSTTGHRSSNLPIGGFRPSGAFGVVSSPQSDKNCRSFLTLSTQRPNVVHPCRAELISFTSNLIEAAVVQSTFTGHFPLSVRRLLESASRRHPSNEGFGTRPDFRSCSPQVAGRSASNSRCSGCRVQTLNQFLTQIWREAPVLRASKVAVSPSLYKNCPLLKIVDRYESSIYNQRLTC
jgi:hypothetical protein